MNGSLRLAPLALLMLAACTASSPTTEAGPEDTIENAVDAGPMTPPTQSPPTKSDLPQNSSF